MKPWSPGASRETRDRPVVLVLSRQNVPTLDRSRYAPADGLRRALMSCSMPPTQSRS
jgi:transketolase